MLYVYDVMRNDLLTEANGQTNLLKSVYQSSREICLKVSKKTKETYAWRLTIFRLECISLLQMEINTKYTEKMSLSIQIFVLTIS